MVHDASELTGAPSTSVLVMPHAAHQPPAPEPPQKRAGSSDAARRHGLIRDHTVFHVVTSYRASPEIVAPSKRNYRITQRITRTPKRARGLEQVTPQPGHPASWLHDSTSSTRACGVRATLIRWKPSKPTSRSHRTQRSSDTQQQVGPDTARGPLKAAGVEVRSSPGTSTSTRNPQPTPTHPHSTRKSHISSRARVLRRA